MNLDNLKAEIDQLKHHVWVYGYADLTEIITSCDFCHAVEKLTEISKSFISNEKYYYELESSMEHLYLKGTKVWREKKEEVAEEK